VWQLKNDSKDVWQDFKCSAAVEASVATAAAAAAAAGKKAQVSQAHFADLWVSICSTT